MLSIIYSCIYYIGTELKDKKTKKAIMKSEQKSNKRKTKTKTKAGTRPSIS